MLRMRPGAMGMIEPRADMISDEWLTDCRGWMCTFAAIASYVLEQPDVDDMRPLCVLLLPPCLLLEGWANLGRWHTSETAQVAKTLRTYCRLRKARHDQVNDCS